MKYILLCIVTILSSVTHANDIEDLSGLLERYNQYYQHERRQEWSRAYDFRGPMFRKAITKDKYIKSMGEDNTGWSLQGFKPMKVWRNNKRVYITTEFTEKAPESYYKEMEALIGAKAINRERVVFEEWSIWGLINGVWYCFEPATRSRLHFNSENIQENVD